MMNPIITESKLFLSAFMIKIYNLSCMNTSLLKIRKFSGLLWWHTLMEIFTQIWDRLYVWKTLHSSVLLQHWASLHETLLKHSWKFGLPPWLQHVPWNLHKEEKYTTQTWLKDNKIMNFQHNSYEIWDFRKINTWEPLWWVSYLQLSNIISTATIGSIYWFLWPINWLEWQLGNIILATITTSKYLWNWLELIIINNICFVSLICNVHTMGHVPGRVLKILCQEWMGD